MKASGKATEDEETKVAMFLNLIGEDAIELFSTYNLTEAEKEISKTVIDAFEAYCVPQRNIVYERYLFYNINQKECEQFEQFLRDIKLIAQKCEFGTVYDQMIRDRIVMGTNDASIQEKLLRVDDLDMQKAINY